MYAGIKKFTNMSDGTLSGHDTTNWGERQGKDIPLGVFGSLSALGGMKYQIKPYAIWYK